VEVADLIDIGRGTVLAGRYRLVERLAESGEGAAWLGRDQALDRDVEIFSLASGDPRSQDVLDAARRAALADDPRLARVLDVGQDQQAERVYVVSEHLDGKALALLAADGPLPAEVARTIAGEAAAALDSAQRRGLHHLVLTPEHVVVLDDGRVRVRGLAVDAAARGTEAVSADEAAHDDVLALARVLRVALAGSRADHDADLPGDTPFDLVRLCGALLGPAEESATSDASASEPDTDDTASEPYDGAATESIHTPGELAVALAPWLPLTPEVLALPTPGAKAGPGADNGEPAEQPASRGRVETMTPPGRRADDVVDLPAATPQRWMGAGADAGAVSGTAAATGAAAAAARRGGDDPGETSEAAALPPERPFNSVWEPAEEDEPLGPLGPQVPLTRPPQEQARFVLAIVAGVVVVGLVLAIFGLRGLGGSASSLINQENGSTPLTTATAPATPSPSASASAPPAASPSASPSTSGPAPVISGIRPIDPQGDGQENDARATRAIDGDPTTAWTSDTYKTAQFGGLKQGLGLVLQLEQRAPVSEVDVNVAGTGGVVELRQTTQQDDVTGTTLLATAQIDGSNPVVLKPDKPVTMDLILLWFTQVPRTSSGANRLEVAEVTVK